MAVYLSPIGGAGWQFFDNSGVPLAGGKLYTYQAGTTTPQVTYTTISGNITRTNPIILDAAGRVSEGGEIWLNFAPYKFVLKTSNDVLLATWDNIYGAGATPYTPQNFVGDGVTVNFTLNASPFNVNSTFAYINGVYQNKNTYSVVGSVLTFSEAPPINSLIEILYN